jgi:hypothetical protein
VRQPFEIWRKYFQVPLYSVPPPPDIWDIFDLSENSEISPDYFSGNIYKTDKWEKY